MKRIIFLIIVFALSAISLQAKERTEKEMQSIASKRLGLSMSAMATKAVNTAVKKVSESKQLAVYNSKGRGFVVIAKDDDFAPVLGYSDTDYDIVVMPCGLKWWMSHPGNKKGSCTDLSTCGICFVHCHQLHYHIMESASPLQYTMP